MYHQLSVGTSSALRKQFRCKWPAYSTWAVSTYVLLHLSHLAELQYFSNLKIVKK